MPNPPDDTAPDLDAAIDALYQVPLDRFTADRNALAAALKKRGERAAADRVKGLAKPSTTAWAVNQVWWRQRLRFTAMLDAGASQREAHVAIAQGRPADVRAAGEARRQAVREVTDAAFDALGGQRTVAPDIQYRIAGTIEALASSGVPAGETAGRLTRDVQSSGLDALSALAEAAGAMPQPVLVTRETAPADRAAQDEPDPPASATSGAAGTKPGETARARQARDRADAAARARAEQLAQAEQRVHDLAAAFASADQAAKTAAAAETEARAALERAVTTRTDLEGALDEARAAEAAGRRDLSQQTAAASRAEMDRARASRDLARARDALERLASTGG